MSAKTAGMVLLVGMTVGFAVWAGKLKNPGFEEDFGAAEGSSVWGDYGEIFGEARQIYDGKDQPIASARTGRRVLQIDASPGTWNGVWQQVKMAEGARYMMTGYCQLHGDLPIGCATFLKVEFYDDQDRLIDYVEGERVTKDTRGGWKKCVLSGITPPGTRSARFVCIAGGDFRGEKVANQIFWDDVDVTE